MTKGDLDGVSFLGRPVKPIALPAAFLMAVLMVYNIVDAGVLHDLWLGDIVSILAGVSCIMLVLGWIIRSQRLIEFGLLAGCVVYVMRASFVIFVDGFAQSFYLSLGAAGLFGGAYFLESWGRQQQHVAALVKHRRAA